MVNNLLKSTDILYNTKYYMSESVYISDKVREGNKIMNPIL